MSKLDLLYLVAIAAIAGIVAYASELEDDRRTLHGALAEAEEIRARAVEALHGGA